MGIATDLIYIVIAALLGGFLAHLLRQPPIFGYILAGVALGPYTGGVTVEHIHDIEMLAEIGVALLLFTLGLQFSFGELRRLAGLTLIGTPIQIVLCGCVGYFVALEIGLSKAEAIWIGAAISLSSTMVVLKTLAARDSLDSTAGRITVAILIAQDLAVVPLMLLLPQLTRPTVGYGLIVSALLKSAAFLLVMYVAGTRLLPRLFAFIAERGSRELFFLSTLAIALGTGFVSHELGLSFALGAFVAGMLLSETDFSHQALSDVLNLRDLFALIFFVSVGMLFDPEFFLAHIGTIVVLAFTIIVSKAVIMGSTLRAFGYGGAVAWSVGIGLSQVGEFAFVIINAGSRSGILSTESFSLMIAVTVVSMLTTPALFWLGTRLSQTALAGETALLPPEDGERGVPSKHVIIIGAGVVGQYVARVLAALERPYIVVESDHKIVMQLRDRGVRVVFGDAARRIILEAAGLKGASLVVITTTNDKILPAVIAEIREVRDEIPVVVRVEEVEDVRALASLRVKEIVQPQLEVGLEMVRQSLLALHIEEAQIFALLGQLRSEHYEPSRDLKEKPAGELRFVTVTRLLEFLWFEVKSESILAQRSLEEAKLREKYGISIVAVVRGQEFIATLRPGFRIAAGDALGILGTRTQLETFRNEN